MNLVLSNWIVLYLFSHRYSEDSSFKDGIKYSFNKYQFVKQAGDVVSCNSSVLNVLSVSESDLWSVY